MFISRPGWEHPATGIQVSADIVTVHNGITGDLHFSLAGRHGQDGILHSIITGAGTADGTDLIGIMAGGILLIMIRGDGMDGTDINLGDGILTGILRSTIIIPDITIRAWHGTMAAGSMTVATMVSFMDRAIR